MMEIFWTMLASQDRKRIREYIAEQNLMLWGHQPLWHDFTGQCCQPGRTDLGRAGTLSDRRRTDDGRGGKRYCYISSGTAAGAGAAENLTAWPVYRNHLRYPDVNPPLVAVSMLMLMYVYISINEE